MTVGDRVQLRSGETIELAHFDRHPQAVLILRFRCVSPHWNGYLGLTERELLRNLA